MGKVVISLVSIIAIAVGLAAPTHAARYTARFIDPPTGMRIAYAFCGINDMGQAIFSSTDSAECSHGYVSNPDGALAEIGFLEGSIRTYPCSINSSGQAVGYGFLSSAQPSLAARSFVWSQAQGIQELPGQADGSPSRAYGINAAGVSVGFAANASGEAQACYWNASREITILSSFGGTLSTAYEVTDSGRIAGYSTTADQQEVAAVWDADGTIHALPALSGCDGYDSRALAINSLGQAIGYTESPDSGNQAMTLWNPDGTVVQLSGWAWAGAGCADINDLGQAVSWLVLSGELHSFIYSRETGVVGLSVPGVYGMIPYQINNSGAISGEGYDQQTGKWRFVVLDPVPVPEPSAIVGLLYGLTTLLLHRRRG